MSHPLDIRTMTSSAGCSWPALRTICRGLGTRTLLRFRHGCSSHRMLFKHERYYASGMDALVSGCSRNTNASMAWAWMLWSPYALGTLSCFWAWVLWPACALETRTLSARCSCKLSIIGLILVEHEHSCTRNDQYVLNRRASYRRRFQK